MPDEYIKDLLQTYFKTYKMLSFLQKSSITELRILKNYIYSFFLIVEYRIYEYEIFVISKLKLLDKRCLLLHWIVHS